MNTRRHPGIDELAVAVTGRAESLFAGDVAHHGPAIEAAVAGRRVLAIGGAGSIGSACLRQLLRFQPAHVCVVDQDENALVELVRDLRSSDCLQGADLRTLPLDFGAPVMRQFLAEQPPFDLVLHFAANKHVRAEKDRCSLLQMLDTNLLKVRRLLGWLQRRGFRGRLFSVSTDKAANPSNLMGASKRLMEILVFGHGALPTATVTSARFANVAFSNGSLLSSWLRRLASGQPIAVPSHTRRYFVTLVEAGHLCLLAATVAPQAHTVIPRLRAERDLVLLTDVASLVVRAHGYEPRFYDEEAAARRAAATDPAAGCYPVLRTPLDTSGEKAFEEFTSDGEAAADIGCRQLQAIPMPRASSDAVHAFLDEVEAELARDVATLHKPDLERRIAQLLPQFAHAGRDKHLDERM